jgi:hypothetical protein
VTTLEHAACPDLGIYASFRNPRLCPAWYCVKTWTFPKQLRRQNPYLGRGHSSKISLLLPGYLFMYPRVTWFWICFESSWALVCYTSSQTRTCINRGILRNHQVETHLTVPKPRLIPRVLLPGSNLAVCCEVKPKQHWLGCATESPFKHIHYLSTMVTFFMLKYVSFSRMDINVGYIRYFHLLDLSSMTVNKRHSGWSNDCGGLI